MSCETLLQRRQRRWTQQSRLPASFTAPTPPLSIDIHRQRRRQRWTPSLTTTTISSTYPITHSRRAHKRAVSHSPTPPHHQQVLGTRALRFLNNGDGRKTHSKAAHPFQVCTLPQNPPHHANARNGNGLGRSKSCLRESVSLRSTTRS